MILSVNQGFIAQDRLLLIHLQMELLGTFVQSSTIVQRVPEVLRSARLEDICRIKELRIRMSV